ncbi:MAG: M23 family metallopeptidase [Gammaproteobacteria bacterium]|nr:M23 family metallopeptidase [Gammaproteobacteria bacterium]NIR91188.1 M23 family metallopeptidase [Gammaproteobacteria bacterium]
MGAIGLCGLALALGAALGWGGYRMGLNAQSDASVTLDAAIERQRAAVQEAIRDAENDLNALAQRLGQMQAHVIRLDALGARLVDVAKLDPGEFAFESSPGRGGPADVAARQPQTEADFLTQLERLAAQLEDREVKLRALEGLLMEGKLQAKVHPAGRPIAEGWMSSHFGYRNDPYSGRRAFHEGIDFAGRFASEIRAVAAGVVVEAGYEQGYGNYVEIKHANGYATRYAHNKKNLVKVGETVQKGQPVALMGSTGRSTGPHVHFEVLHNGKPVNPWKFVRAE